MKTFSELKTELNEISNDDVAKWREEALGAFSVDTRGKSIEKYLKTVKGPRTVFVAEFFNNRISKIAVFSMPGKINANDIRSGEKGKTRGFNVVHDAYFPSYNLNLSDKMKIIGSVYIDQNGNQEVSGNIPATVLKGPFISYHRK